MGGDKIIDGIHPKTPTTHLQVHRFDQEADECLHWLEEKEAAQLVADQDDVTNSADAQTIQVRSDHLIDLII